MAEVVVNLESILALQEKYNNSLQAAGRTLFGRIVDMLPFTSNGENFVQGDSSNSTGNNMSLEVKEVPADSQLPSPSVKEFKFDDLKKATRDFSPDLLLSEGSFEKVFLGWVDKNTLAPSKHGDGIAVDVKRFNIESRLEYVEWQLGANFLHGMAHPNIISLLGYCRDEPEHLLVYEHMPNKSLDRFLFTDAPNIEVPLSWGTRLLIMIGVARGLKYLHSANIIFRDLKPSSILLDEDFNAKLGDFALAAYGPETGETHVTTRVIGIYSYVDPEYILTGHLTMKADIYRFGVVLLESITGQKVLDLLRPDEKDNLVNWVTQITSNRRKLQKIIDPRLEHKYPLKGASECFALALRCVANKARDRPSSDQVLKSLEQIYVLHK